MITAKKSIFCLLCVAMLLPKGNARSNDGSNKMPDVNWIRAEISQILDNKRVINGEILAELISVDVNNLNSTTLSTAIGNFTSKQQKQILITIPASAKPEKNLGWETNLWLLVEQDSTGFHTLGSIRGDVAYQNAVMDVNGDGLDEISMVNHTREGQCERVSYKIFSFFTQSLLYVSETRDNWSTCKDKVRKNLKKGDLLYNVLENQYIDIDNDGNVDIVEKWIEFRYNGGRSIADIEQRKTMKIRSRILTLKDGIYQ